MNPKTESTGSRGSTISGGSSTARKVVHDKVLNRPINVQFIHPPIPMRQFDWCATFEGYDEGDPQGFGETPQDAVVDLFKNLDEDLGQAQY